MTRLLAVVTALALAGAAPAAARTSPPKHPSAAKREAAKQRAARKRAVARHRAALRRREAARRKALAEALAPAPAADPAPAPAEEPAAPAAPAPVPAEPAAPAAPLARAVGITQREFSLALSRGTVGIGDVMVQVVNRGEDGHDLRIDAPDGTQVWFFDELPSLGATLPTIVPLLQTGSYRVYCTLPGHADLGMSTQLTVAAG